MTTYARSASHRQGRPLYDADNSSGMPYTVV
jgi:hypothetical protein